jgi:glycine/D-amino acid oxidase-like deaminating enzyme/nitrite reductase/ring-hydroxylating ferredoxin subunit
MHRVDGWLFGATPADVDVLVREMEAAQRAGLVDVQLVERAPLPFETGRALRFAGQLELHPVLYLEGLARAIERAGGMVYERTRAVRIEGGKDAHVATAHGPVVRASAIAVATNTPVNDLVAVHTKQASYQTYVIALEVPLDAVPHGLYWDTAEPYHYVRVVRGLRQGVAHEQLIVGGEDHKTGQEEHPEQRWTRLEQWTRARFPQCGAVTQRWSGQVLEPVDGLAFIGKNPLDHDNVHVVTGDSGNGMTHGTIAGLLLRDLIRGRENPWAALYAPNRKSLRSLGRFARENLNVAKEYAQWLGKGDVADVSEIARGEGAIVRRGVRPVAVYVDEQGKHHEHSGVCPHLGCIVAWNRAEKSWDCPCHGSRFDPEGRMIHGPSQLDLAPAEELRTERSA